MATKTSLPPHVVRRYQERVERGAKALDEKLPGWWRHIRIKRLDMAMGVFEASKDSGCGCVGAQVAEAYASLRQEYTDGTRTGFYDDTILCLFGRQTHQTEVAHGFIVGMGDGDEAYRLLDKLWAEQVRARRGKR